MAEVFRCGRRGAFSAGSPFSYDQVEKQDHWRADGTCSYCGSISGDTFMARCAAQNVELGPTDKSYKVYVHNCGGELFPQRYRNCPRDAACTYESCTHWVTEQRDHAKFYFQHLSEEQMNAFIELYNAKKLKLGYPGHFYVSPFFMRPVRAGTPDAGTV